MTDYGLGAREAAKGVAAKMCAITKHGDQRRQRKNGRDSAVYLPVFSAIPRHNRGRIFDMRNFILSALSYFGIVFLTGSVLGVVRTVWLAPWLGERHAELLEMPIMLVVAYVTAGYVINRFRLPGVKSACLVGVVALVLLLALEFTLVLELRGLSVAEYLQSRDPLSGAAYAFSLLVYGALPGIRKFVRERSVPLNKT
jgi:hypothetical protein